MPFDSTTYRLQNQRQGKPVRWWKSTPCECVDPVTNQQTDPTCTLCERDGRRYSEQELPLGEDGQALKVLVSETSQAIETADFGLLAVGSTKLSLFTDLMPVARLDRVSLPDRFESHREVLVRGEEGTTDKLTFGLGFVNILHCHQGGAELDIDDYVVTNTGRVNWVNGGPEPGSRYTFEYLHYPLFYIAHCLHNPGLGSDNRPLPSEWVLSVQPPTST